ncbi:hypothetical protein [Streptomyces turgidiscabies]|uniref:Lipoprotein n=1 Tax=Streptomyces turgidiscabies TaxID=85558 RepID=A0ABU0RTQ9_9ACTN|nr:hypothetical protein [Streptomyces turgidiscabies]MDQ0934305.1 hypothetical protein [Streptomyces turgidiscabies]
MRHARRRRRRMPVAAAALAVAAPLLGGCGIQPTDVIEAGGPPSFQAFLNRDYDMLLFFRSPDGGVVPVIRTTSPSYSFGDGYTEPGSGQNLADLTGPARTERVVQELLAGPGTRDRTAGLSTALPALPARPVGTAEVDPFSAGRVTARLPLALERLNSTALRQLTCTIAYSTAADGRAVVQLTGQDGTSRTATCPRASGSPENAPAGTPSPVTTG